MHELPQPLADSLKSWRGSVHGNNRGGESRRPHSSDNQKDFQLHSDGGSVSSEELDEKDVEKSLEQPRTTQLNRRQDNQQGHQDSAEAQKNNTVNVKTEDANAAKNASASPQQQKKSVFTGPKVADPDPAADRLDDNKTPLTPQHFFELMGMSPPAHSRDGYDYPPSKRLGTSHGLYKRVHDQFEYTQTKYRIFDILTYSFLVLQILLSAVFIILGGLKVESHVAVAVLGAISVVISGALALMKGQGLPNRLRQMRDSLGNVIFEMEELYADVCAGRGVLFKEVEKVREDYLRVMEEARANHPETFNPSTKGLGPGSGFGKGGVKGMAK